MPAARPARRPKPLSAPANRRPPRVSVVIPAFNAAHTIERALESVAAQRGVTCELIVIDDGSADDTAEVVCRWGRGRSGLRLIRQENRGVAAARNAGLEAASGEWMCFLDADDWLSRSAFKRLLQLATEQPEASVLVGRAVRVSSGGARWTYPWRDLGDPFRVLSAHCPIAIHSALVRRTVVVAAGGFDESLKSSEDWDLWQRVARAGHAFVQTRSRVAFYRARAGSLSRDLPSAARQGLEVMRRAHRRDPRVATPAAAYAAGAAPDDLPTHEAYYLLWAAGRDIAGGGDGLSTVRLLDRRFSSDFDPDVLGELIASGMADLLACRPHELGVRWPEFGPKLERVLELAYPDAHHERLRRLALAAIQGQTNAAGGAAAIVLDLADKRAPDLAGSEAFACVQLRCGEATLGVISLPFLAERPSSDVAAAVSEQTRHLRLGPALRAMRPWWSLAFWIAVARECLRLRGLGLRLQVRRPGNLTRTLRARARHALGAGLEAAIRSRLSVAGAQPQPSPHAEAAAAIGGALKTDRERSTERLPEGPDQGLRPVETQRSQAWDEFFQQDDPWNYGASAYERQKYQDTLELIPEGPAAEALELACAEGHFTPHLAARARRLLATDISATAVARAAERCRGAGHVSFRTLDFMRQPLPGQYDLIVCSEVLYYAGARLPAVARKLADALRPGGLLVMAHGNEIADEPEETGFDWGSGFGAKTISETFSAAPGLVLEAETRRPLYRVQSFRKGPPSAARTRTELRPLNVELEPPVARAVVWGGGESRVKALHRELSIHAPVLMYHRIAPQPGPAALERYRIHPDVFAEQISFLRRRGYWGVTPARLADALSANEPLPGRPVMITFDDGYADFAEHAWPILQKHDMAATVFVVAGKAGGPADWDAEHGRVADLLSWSDVRTLAQEGVSIESHAWSHRPLTRLPVEDVYQELLASRDMIAEATGSAPTAICYPYGAADGVIERAARECGYRLGFSAAHGVANLASRPLHLPRLEVAHGDDLDSFARRLGLPRPSAGGA